MQHRKHFLIAVVLICYAVCAGDEECLEMRRRVLCYECSTRRNEPHCRDPFNKSSPKAKAFLCDGHCVKWVQKHRNGLTDITRTCATKLTLNLNPALVCMKESRPGDGHMCFCNSKKCNHANSLRISALIILPFFMMAAKFA